MSILEPPVRSASESGRIGWPRCLTLTGVPFGLSGPESPPWAYGTGITAYAAKLAIGAPLLALFETTTAKMRVFRVPGFLGAALMLGFLGTLLLFVSRSL